MFSSSVMPDSKDGKLFLNLFWANIAPIISRAQIRGTNVKTRIEEDPLLVWGKSIAAMLKNNIYEIESHLNLFLHRIMITYV